MKLVRALALIAVLVPSMASAFSTGVGTGSFPDAPQGCNFAFGCHTGGLAPTVTLSGPTTVTPGSVNTYLLEIVALGSQLDAGFNASASAGSLAVGGADSALTQLLLGEMTHTARKTNVGGVTRFSFDWTAPGTAGSETIDAWGNAVDGNFASLGDQASMASLSVTVANPPAPPVPALPTAGLPFVLGLLLFGAGTWHLTRRARSY